MLGLLGDIFGGIEAIGSFMLWGIEQAVNAVLAALAAAFAVAEALLPSMPSGPLLTGTPTWLSWLNWFYPVAELVAGLVAVAGMWLTFLVVRYVLRAVRAI
jgi:hypothetical protein